MKGLYFRLCAACGLRRIHPLTCLESTMVKKLQKMSADKKTTPHLSGAVKESAQQIWLAGLGAFSKAQEEGSKVFDTLVKEGLSIQRKTQAVAEEKISEATSKMANMATDIQSKAGHQWDKLENIFEERVAKALNKLGVPSAKDVDALIARIDELNKNVQKMSGKAPAAAKAPATKKAATAAAKPATAKPVSAKPAATKRPATKRTAKPAAATKPATDAAATA
jgi:poly(hydroxyalkanoate) granule-associated protein